MDKMRSLINNSGLSSSQYLPSGAISANTGKKIKMSFLNWFSKKFTSPAAAVNKENGAVVRDGRAPAWSTHEKPVPASLAKRASDPGHLSAERKVKRHARREQLCMAVREASTHAGVLSSTYQLKVLSLDPTGNEFLVMMDIDQSFDRRAEKLSDMEAKIIQLAKNRYEICVTSVYWRVTTSPASLGSRSPEVGSIPLAVATPKGQSSNF